MANGNFTKEDFWGKSLTTVLWLVALFGAPMTMVYGIENYPLENENHPIYWQLPGACVAVSFTLCILCRKKLYPWGRKAPWLVWAGSLALSTVPAMLIFGGFLIINGILETPLIPAG